MILFFVLFLAAFAAADILPEPAFTRPSADSLKYFSVDSIVVINGDAFDDSKAYSWADRTLYDIGNTIHIETRKSVVKKLLLFDKGDKVNLYELIESEKNLRSQAYIADAHIHRKVTPDGKNILYVQTSDNWTLSPAASLDRPDDGGFSYGIGIWENNFLGFGQTIGVYYSHDPFRDKFMGLYNNSNFLFRNNRFEFSISENTDGYTHYATMYLPYLSRKKNEWAYTIAGFVDKQDTKYYWTGGLPSKRVSLSVADSVKDQLPIYNREHGNAVLRVNEMEEDSASFRLGHSFGGEEFKIYLGASYDYHRLGRSYKSVSRYRFIDEDDDRVYALDSTAVEDWVPEQLDSRLGLNITLSRIRYDRLTNFKHAKWTEDIEKGYSLKVGISKNWKALGAMDNDARLDYKIYLALGSRMHHLMLNAKSYFYFNSDTRRDIYEFASLEYIWRSNEWFSTQLAGYMDTYKRAAYGRQLSLGGLAGQEFYGFPTYLYTGQARFYGQLEERFFPHFELGTVAPVFAVFFKAGETSASIHEFEPRDLTYIAGFGVRFVMTKSVSGLVNHINLSWPLNGPLVSKTPRFSLVALLSL